MLEYVNYFGFLQNIIFYKRKSKIEEKLLQNQNNLSSQIGEMHEKLNIV